MKYVARNEYIYGMQKNMRNDVSHIKFEQPVQKLYKQIVCGGHLGFSLCVHFLQPICKVVHLGCVCGYFVKMISTGQFFQHMPLKSFWLPGYTSEIMSFLTILAALLDLPLESMFRSIALGIH